MTGARLRQSWADLMASFWLRPLAMTLAAILLAVALIGVEGLVRLPAWLEGWVYAGGTAGARDVLGTIAAATIGVAGTTFSITVAALTLASNQMGPRLLRNFTRDAGNQYALGALLATFAYALVALRSVHEAAEGAFVPQLAVSVGLLMAFGCVGVLIWFLHHVATSINVDRVVALVYRDVTAALAAALAEVVGDLPELPPSPLPEGLSAPLLASGSGYLRVLDEDALADWAAGRDAMLWLHIRPGDFVFAGTEVAEVVPHHLQAEAEALLGQALTLGDARSVEQDLEFAVRQLVEIGLRALSAGINDPFTAIAVLDRLGAALCDIAGRSLPSTQLRRAGRTRLVRPVTDYAGLVDTMFHMLRQAGATQPAVVIRLIEVLTAVGEAERDPARRATLREHVELARDAGMEGTRDAAALRALVARHAAALAALRG